MRGSLLSMSGDSASDAPTSAPRPVTLLTTPFGKPTSAQSWASSIELSGVYSLGLMTMVLPAASAGASFTTTQAMG